MIVVADNLTASRPRVRRALKSRDARSLARICQDAEQKGAAWLDLNPGFWPEAQRAEVWRFLIQCAEASCSVKLMLDAPTASDLEMAIGFCSRPVVLNMATAQAERLGPVLDLAAHHGVEVVAALMTDVVPTQAQERLRLAALIAAEAGARFIPMARLYLDPMVMPLALPGGEAHAKAVIEVLRVLPSLFEEPPGRLIALSNLITQTARADARAAAAPFMAAAWGAGLEAIMLNVEDEALMDTAKLLAVFEGARIFAPGEYQ